MNRLTDRKTARWIFAAVLAGALTPGLLAQDAEPDKEKDKGTAHQKEAMDVIANYIEAIGGKEALRKHKHRTLVGELSIPAMNMRGPLKMQMAAPNKFLMTATIPGAGEMRQGFDGKVAWSVDPMQGPMLIENPQAEDIRRQADFYGELNYAKNYKTIEYAGKERFDGVEAHKLRLVDRIDKESFAFFNTESALYIGVRSEMESHMGKLPMTTIVSDYREVDGVKIPMLIRVQMMQMEQHMKIESINHDEIDPSTFDLPPGIKALLPADDEKEKEEKKEEPAAVPVG